AAVLGVDLHRPVRVVGAGDGTQVRDRDAGQVTGEVDVGLDQAERVDRGAGRDGRGGGDQAQRVDAGADLAAGVVEDGHRLGLPDVAEDEGGEAGRALCAGVAELEVEAHLVAAAALADGADGDGHLDVGAGGDGRGEA